MTYVITQPCIDVKSKSCIEECPVDAIYEGLSMLYIHPDVCVDNGACEVVCPVEAIFYEDDVPEYWTRFIAAGQDFASRVPGGGACGVEYGFDSPLIFLPDYADPAPAPAAEPSPFFQGQAGTHIAALWDRYDISLEMVKALLLIFDKVALIGKDVRPAARPSEAGQWDLLTEMGLVAQVAVADAFAIVDSDWARALFDTLLARNVVTRSTSHLGQWRRSVLYRIFRRLDEPAETMARAIPQDDETLEIVTTFMRWMFEEAVATRGLAVHDVTTELNTAEAFTKAAAGLAPAARTVTLPCEWVLPPCAEASVEQLVEFRTAAGPSYRRYLDRLTDAMMSLSLRTDEAAPADSYSPDQVADEIYALRRLMRDLPWLGRGYIGFGLTGNAGLPRVRDAEDVVQAISTRRTAQDAGLRPRGLFMAEPARSSWI
jgi:NAD-dependent dihydropyrimidine dehydrogenase PreA subunit